MTNQRLVKTNTVKKLKNFWRTSQEAYNDACYLCGVSKFDIDVAASRENKLCTYYIDENQNALSFESWFADDCVGLNAVWCNPPFDQKTQFLDKAYEQISKSNSSKLICMMIPYEPATKWWRNHVHDKASIVYVPDGRYCFRHPETGELMGDVNFASCFVIFSGFKGPTTYHHFNRGCAAHAELEKAS
ncbi:MAG TPA: hypothetical protein DCF92_07030 [Idiomarina sp.]|mgnify:CR=1 FL=1|nr:hypothetical protein [Idiomarina sp.]